MTLQRLAALAVWPVLACGSSGPPVTALYDLDRRAGFYAAPFPSDLLRTPEGTIDAAGLPLASEGLGAPIFAGYVRRLRTSVRGFGLNGAIYFQFSGALDEAILARMAGRPPTPADPVMLLPLGGAASDLVPLEVHFHRSALGDPYLADHLLVVQPRAGSPLRGGTAYAAILTDALRASGGGSVLRDTRFDAVLAGRDANAAAVLQVDRLRTTLAALGVPERRVVAATVFTTQDVDGELEAIRRRAEAAIQPEHLEPMRLKEVRRIEYIAGVTSGRGRPATLLTVTFMDGTTDVTELEAETVLPPPADLGSGSFPYRVFEARLRVPNLQGLSDKPYGRPGLGLLADAENDTGQIRFARGAGGQLEVASPVEPEEVRITIALPLDAQRRLVTRAPVLFYDHGTGHSAYQAIWPDHGDNRGQAFAELFARHRLILVSRDQPLFAQRFPSAVDAGYNSFLIAYNVANITAFRDTLRQSAVDNLVLYRFVRERLNAALAAAGVSAEPVADTDRLFRFGHSLGSVTTHLGVAALPEGSFRASLVSGSGGIFTLYFLESGLLPRLAGDPQNLGLLLMALDIDPETEVTAQELLGGLAGVPRGPARAAIARWHPILTLAQTILDPADPIVFARRLTLPVTIVRGTGDLQVPNSATDALSAALPNDTVERCDATRDYDPHQCTFREDAGIGAVRRWLERYVPATAP